MQLTRRFIQLTLLCFVISSPQVQASNDENQSAQQVFTTINNRLNYMPDVALYKAQNQLAIEDLTREKVVIAAAVKNIEQLGLNPNSVKQFFHTQINAAKAIQYRYRADLLSSPIERLAPNLNQTIRPALITLGNLINHQIASHIKQFGRFKPSQQQSFIDTLKQPLLSKQDKQRLFDSLLEIK